MTMQAGELLEYDGTSYLMWDYPLEIYFKLGGGRVPFMAQSTMCWRGYSGTWKIEDGQLQLIDLEGYIAEEPMKDIAHRAFAHEIDYDDRSLCRLATIDAVFPGSGGPIFAHWFSGAIEAKDADTRSFKLFAEVKHGQVINVRIAPIGDRS